MSEKDKTPMPRARWRRWYVYTGAAIVVLLLLAILLPGPLLRYGLKTALEDVGFKNVVVQRSDASIFELLFGVGGLDVEAPDGSHAKLRNIKTDLSWASLFEKHIQFELIELSGFQIKIERDAEGRFLIGGLPLPVQETEVVVQADADKLSGGWTFGTDRVLIADSLITYHQGDAAIKILARKLEVKGIEGRRPREAAFVDLVGEINGKPLTLSGTVRPLSDPIAYDLKVGLSELDLAPFKPFSNGILDALAGTLVSDLHIIGDVSTKGVVDAVVSGSLQFNNLEMQAGAVTLSQPELKWAGEVVIKNSGLHLDGEITAQGGRLINGKRQIAMAGISGQLAPMEVIFKDESGALRLKWDGGARLAKPVFKQPGLSFKGEGLNWRGNVDLAMGPQTAGGRLAGKLKLQAINLTQAPGLSLQQQALEVDINIVLPNLLAGDNLKMSGTFAAKGQGTKLVHRAADLAGLTLERIDLKGSADLLLSAPAPTGVLAATVSLGPLSLKTAESGVALKQQSMQLQGSFKLGRGDKAGAPFDAAVSLQLGATELTGPQPMIAKMTLKGLEYKGSIKGNSARADSLSTTGRLTINGWRGAIPIAGIERAEFSRFSYAGQSQLAPAGIKGAFEIDDLKAALPDAGIFLSSKKMSFNADARISGPSNDPVRIAGNFKASGVDLNDGKGLDYINLGSVALTGLRTGKGGGVAAAQIRLGDLKLLRSRAGGKKSKAPWLLQLAGVMVKGLKLKPDGAIAVSAIDLSGLTAVIVRTTKGITGLPGGTTGKSAKGAGGGDLPALKIARLELKGDSRLAFIDTTVKPNVKLNIQSIALKLRNIDTRAGGKPMAVDLRAAVGEFTKLNLSGTVQPFAKKKSANIKLKLAGLSLPRLSPYAAQMGGVHFKTGRLDADLEGKVVREQIDANLTALLSKVTMEQLEPREIKLSEKASIPLETALNLLRDDDGQIRLHVPIKGNLSDPDFKLDQVVNKAVGNAIFGALKVVFPPALLLSALAKAGKGKLGFPPIAFSAGEAGLSGDQQQGLDKLAGLMGQRPGIKLNVCGVATASDWAAIGPKIVAEKAKAAAEKKEIDTGPAQTAVAEKKNGDRAVAAKPDDKPLAGEPDREALAKLATERSRAVKLYLVKQKGVTAKRLFECRAKVALKGEETPRVDLSL